jgi:hypothetical protein
MFQIQYLTLIVAIQAIDTELGRMAAELEAGPDVDDGGELEENMLKYSNAALDLKAQYEAARAVSPDMLPYETLAKHS